MRKTRKELAEEARQKQKAQVGQDKTAVVNFPATQAISAVSLPAAPGVSTVVMQNTQQTKLASLDGKTVKVDTDNIKFNSPQHVIVDSVPAIAGVVEVSNLPAVQHVIVDSQAVSPTQPVSGPLTDSQLRASSVPVDVTFPATQEVTSADIDSVLNSIESAINDKANAQHVIIDEDESMTHTLLFQILIQLERLEEVILKRGL